ncbi:hypothetical protein IFM89_036862 [Coptis chinensis]|uniref:Uncharacterized protein n=1 Tax=Coptis chinensis TaxID=261450 RepID=A0A835HHZ5_9MAGN|nr:hypothetical protein IFM89_036862 [Coptis chinensis]
MGNPCNEKPILPTKVVLGSNRLHKSSRRSSKRSGSEATTTPEVIDADNYQRFEFRAPSWIPFPSVASSQRRKSSALEDVDVDGKNSDRTRTMSNAGGGGDGLISYIILALGPIKMETQKTEVLNCVGKRGTNSNLN